MSAKRFRIAFSFAGEKRAFVEQVADILAAEFGKEKILYDFYHQAEFANADLAFDLPSLYKEQSDLIVAVLCKDYDKKPWCGLEWRAIYSLVKGGDSKQILLSRFDYADGKGLHGLAGFIELERETPQSFAKVIMERLNLSAKNGRKRKCSTPRKATPTSAPASNRALIPNNLPRLPYFFGREKELATIARALEPASRAWCVLIDGPGGMGKTSLAIRAAESVSPDHYQRILFLSAKEREMTADGQRRLDGYILPGYQEMLNEMARQLHITDWQKRPEAERPRLLHDALAARPSLLILDNLESLAPEHRDRIYTLLERVPAGTKAIVTSRRRTDIGALIIRLEKLEPDAARAFLDELFADRPHLTPPTAEQCHSLYTHTGGNPLVMRWVVGQLGRGKCKDIPRALDFLRSAPANNDPLGFIFGDLLDTFTAEETATLSALTHYTSPIAIKHIAEIAGLPVLATTTALEDLSSRALVIADATEENYILTPLVADYLRKARPEAVRQSGDRLEKHAYARIMECGDDTHERFPELEAEWPGLAPAIPLFLAGDNERLQSVCDALRTFLSFQGRWDERLSLSEKAEARALAANDFFSAGWRASEAGFVHFLRRNAEAVLECAARATAHWGVAKAGARERAIANRLRGMGHQLMGDYPAALAAYRESLDLHRSLFPESKDVASCLNDLAAAEHLSGDLPAAEEHYRESLRIARAIGYAEGVATCTGNLAELALARDDWTAAEALAREALPLSEKVGRKQLIAISNHHLAIALVRQSRAAEALPHARCAVEIYTDLGSPDLAEAQATLADCRKAMALERLTPGWTQNTTALEGTTLTVDEVAALLQDAATRPAQRPAEHIAATMAQADANKWVADFLKQDRDWTADDLFKLHTLIMHGSTVDYLKPIGAWKCEDNGTSIKLDGKTTWNDAYAAARHVPALMTEWLADFNHCRGGSGDPLADHIRLHATFARIHPFADGNGRMARLLANYPLLAAGRWPVNIPATARDRYLSALARWQIACGPPRPGEYLWIREELLADFAALCRESCPDSSN